VIETQKHRQARQRIGARRALRSSKQPRGQRVTHDNRERVTTEQFDDVGSEVHNKVLKNKKPGKL
jgi:hypothetical protein